MRTNDRVAGLALCAAIGLSAPADADDWDFGTDSDNGISTDNALFHGSEQVHDLGVSIPGTADQDWYLASVREFSSYQFVVDGFTGDLDLTGTNVQRLSSASIVQENGLVSDAGGVISLNWLRGAGATPDTNFVRIQGANCGLGCNERASYRARFYDTTYTVPRFNNSGTQTTVLLLQNTTDRTCGMTVYYLNASGNLLGSISQGLFIPKALVVLPTAATVPNESGSVRIAHTCGYGGLSGKAVALEASSGFTFDTAVLHRPH